MRKSATLWALVTDSGFGRLVELERSPTNMRELATRESETRHLTSRELMTGSSGRDYDASGPVSHSKHPRSDPHDEAELAFVQEWVGLLEESLAAGRFDRLMVVADPRTLGRLRGKMSDALRATVIQEENLNLAKLAPKELEQRLRKLAGWP